MIELDKIYNEDCLEGMKRIPDGSVDCIICDLPYGTTRNQWDSVIPLDKLWEQYKRVCKPSAAIVLFGQEPFSTKLRISNLEWFRYDWIWRKPCGTGFLNANRMPLKIHEVISVFYKNLPTYNPQFTQGKPYKMTNNSKGTSNYGKYKNIGIESDGRRYPVDVLDFKGVNNGFPVNGIGNTIHPTQKPVELICYLVMTYSNQGDTILDNCMGGGTTAIACIREKRHFIGFELNKEYFDKSLERIKEEKNQLRLF